MRWPDTLVTRPLLGGRAGRVPPKATSAVPLVLNKKDGYQLGGGKLLNTCEVGVDMARGVSPLSARCLRRSERAQERRRVGVDLGGARDTLATAHADTASPIPQPLLTVSAAFIIISILVESTILHRNIYGSLTVPLGNPTSSPAYPKLEGIDIQRIGLLGAS